eukprot:TRINITY_DN72_c0_g1_i8.p1 TRINITY_DN72_c0_g1~~TRINITY_DN72_c0_g1_i8.p1  ORF type:complete len:509 (+),score=71.37 TRINITY_DN72_c0_g1_i8:105-1631(+)
MTPDEDLAEIERNHEMGVEASMLYWNNDFEKARRILDPIMETPRGMLEEACLSLSEDILKGSDKRSLIAKFQAAGDAAETSMEHKQSLYKKFSGIFKSNNNKMVRLQVLEHKLVIADSLLDASLGHLQSNNYITGCLGMRKAWSAYTQLEELVNQCQRDVPQCIIDGYKFGLGAFHLCLSVLPHSVIVVLRIAGINIHPAKGIEYLTSVVNGKGVRYPVASLMLLGFYLCSPSGYIAPKLDDAKSILNNTVVDFPANRTFTVFDAYYHRKKGDLKHALEVVTTVTGGGGEADNIPLFLKVEFLFAMFNFDACQSTAESLLGSEYVDSSFAHYQQLLFILSGCCYITGDTPKGDRILATVSTDSVYRRAMQNRSGTFSKTGMLLSPILYMILNRDINHLDDSNTQLLRQHLNIQSRRVDPNDGYCSCLMKLANGILQQNVDMLEAALGCKKQFPILAALAAYELGGIKFQSNQFSAAKSYLSAASKIDTKFDSLSKRISVAMDQVAAKL